MDRNRDPITTVVQPLDGTHALYDIGLTLVQPFYGEIDRLKRLYCDSWVKYNVEIKNKLRIILADDCGTPAIHETVERLNRNANLDITVYRITKNLRYNTAGALNLGVTNATTDFILMMDNDCTFLPDQMHKVMQLKPLDGWLYKFKKDRITNDPRLKAITRYLPCTNLLHRNVFDAVGGFDEDFTGEYSGGYGYFDCHFDYKVLQKSFTRGCVRDVIATEYMDALDPNIVGTGLDNIKKIERTEGHMRTNKSLYRKKQNNHSLNNYKILRFPWEKVYESAFRSA